MKALVTMSNSAALLAHVDYDLKHVVHVHTCEYSTWLPIACGRAIAAILGTTFGSDTVQHVWKGCVTNVGLLRSYLIW